MIKTPISGQCLNNAEIKHNLFIGPNKCELHLWDIERYYEALRYLYSAGICPDNIHLIDGAYYKITF